MTSIETMGPELDSSDNERQESFESPEPASEKTPDQKKPGQSFDEQVAKVRKIIDEQKKLIKQISKESKAGNDTKVEELLEKNERYSQIIDNYPDDVIEQAKKRGILKIQEKAVDEHDREIKNLEKEGEAERIYELKNEKEYQSEKAIVKKKRTKKAGIAITNTENEPAPDIKSPEPENVPEIPSPSQEPVPDINFPDPGPEMIPTQEPSKDFPMEKPDSTSVEVPSDDFELGLSSPQELEKSLEDVTDHAILETNLDTRIEAYNSIKDMIEKVNNGTSRVSLEKLNMLAAEQLEAQKIIKKKIANESFFSKILRLFIKDS
jgi:hypothetical protein